MKKVLIGCGAIALVLVLILGVAVWKIGSFARQAGQQMAEVVEQYEELNKRLPFSPPADGLVDAGRLDAWLAVRREALTQAEEFGKSMENASFGTLLSMPDKISQFGHEFIDRLETAALPPAEYEWITGQVISAVDSGDARANPEMKEIVTAFDSLGSKDGPPPPQFDVRSLRKPITSEQAASLCTLLIERKEPLLKQMDVFYIDTMLKRISEGMAQKKNTRTTGGEGRQSRKTGVLAHEDPIRLSASG